MLYFRTHQSHDDDDDEISNKIYNFFPKQRRNVKCQRCMDTGTHAELK